jgi:hypothetical protein
MIHSRTTSSRLLCVIGALVGIASLVLPGYAADDKKPATSTANKKPAGDDKKPAYPSHPDAKNVKITPDAWKTAPHQPLTPPQVDQLLSQELKNDKLTPAPPTSDEQFIRRVTLDLTGKLPLPADVEEFAADKDPTKRHKLIDRLLASDEYAHHWARYWRDVLLARATSERVKRTGLALRFEEWMMGELKANRSWGDIVHDIIQASGELRFDSADAKNGDLFFMFSHEGADAANERAAEVSRVFLGIQIQCAQCHDHPSDIWKRNQFHELAAFFARTRERPIRDQQRLVGFALISTPRGEHEMPDKDDPKKTTTVHPKFLTGEIINHGMDDQDRRKALAKFITSKENYWFSAAYVNRIWGDLMGQGFYQPVDNMGPLQEATYPNLLVRLAASFKASNYDTKALFRLIMNSQAYQRQIRLGDQANEHLHFAGTYPTRLRADALWDSLVGALGPLQPERPGMGVGGKGPMPGPFMRRFSLEGVFEATFGFDPSTKSDEVEGSVPQALMLMNNPAINNRMKATGNTVLEKILTSYPDNDEAIKMLYLRVLARKPTANEADTCRKYLAEVGKRNEAFEDILWTLTNSAEFQTKR